MDSETNFSSESNYNEFANEIPFVINILQQFQFEPVFTGVRCSSMVRVFAHGAMGRRIDPSWGGPSELFLVPASAPRLV